MKSTNNYSLSSPNVVGDTGPRLDNGVNLSRDSELETQPMGKTRAPNEFEKALRNTRTRLAQLERAGVIKSWNEIGLYLARFFRAEGMRG